MDKKVLECKPNSTRGETYQNQPINKYIGPNCHLKQYIAIVHRKEKKNKR